MRWARTGHLGWGRRTEAAGGDLIVGPSEWTENWLRGRKPDRSRNNQEGREGNWFRQDFLVRRAFGGEGTKRGGGWDAAGIRLKEIMSYENFRRKCKTGRLSASHGKLQGEKNRN